MLNRALISLIVLALPTYLVRWTLFGVPTTLLELIIFGAFIVVMVQPNSWRRLIPKLKSRTMWWIGLFVMAALEGIVVAADKTQALGAFKGWVLDPILVTIIILAQKESVKIYRTVVACLGITGAVVALWGLIQAFGWLTYQLPYQLADTGFANYLLGHRAVGPFESPNYLAMYLVPVWFLLFGLEAKTKIIKLCRLAGLVILLLSVIATQSIGGWLALAIGLVLVFRLQMKRMNLKRAQVIAFWVGLAGLIMAIGWLAPTRIESSFGPRIEIWRDAATQAIRQPILGIGLRQYNIILDNGQTHNHPHNLYLATWLYTGIIGLVTLMVVVCRTFIRNRLRPDITQWLTIALVAILVHGLLDTTIWKNDLAVVFWLIIGLSLISESRENAKS